MAPEPPAGWSYDGEAFVRVFDRGNFDGSIAFVNAVAALANRLDHHPAIALSWNEVTIRTWSHDANAVTERDVRLAVEVDALAEAAPG